MIGASLLPFQFASGVTSSPRTGSAPASGSEADGFADAMHGALDAPRTTRREDSGVRATRRPEPAPRPRAAADTTAAAPPRKAKPAARPDAKKADRDDESAADDAQKTDSAESSAETAAAADQSETARADAKADADAAGQAGEPAGDSVDCAAAAAAAADAAATAAAVAQTGDVDGDAAAGAGEDPIARGRRWTTGAEHADDHAETAPNGAAQRGTGAGLQVGHAIQQARADAAAAPGQALAEIAKDAVASAHAELAAGQESKGEVTQAAETVATTKPTATTNEAIAAIENAVSAVEAVTAAEQAASAGDSQTQEQPQPKPQGPGTESSAAAAVAVGAPTDGIRFTVAGAAGNAAYASAAPRGEEAVLPQIVQSIRLHAVQGTTEARVQLKPEHLGTLNITLRVEQNQVTATIQADVAAVRQWIQSHEASLRQALSEQGLNLAKLVVHEDGQQASKDEREGERPRRQPRRRSWRDEEQTFEVMA